MGNVYFDDELLYMNGFCCIGLGELWSIDDVGLVLEVKG
jgi:hypothetical protein